MKRFVIIWFVFSFFLVNPATTIPTQAQITKIFKVASKGRKVTKVTKVRSTVPRSSKAPTRTVKSPPSSSSSRATNSGVRVTQSQATNTAVKRAMHQSSIKSSSLKITNKNGARTSAKSGSEIKIARSEGQQTGKSIIKKKTIPVTNKIYKRPNNATTSAQRQIVQGKPCVDCGKSVKKNFADHKRPLVKEHYETGKIDRKKMRSVDAVQPQCPSCSAKQGGKMSKYSKEMKKHIQQKSQKKEK